MRDYNLSASYDVIFPHFFLRVAKCEGTKVRDYNLSASYDVIFPHFFYLVGPALREQMSGDITSADIHSYVYD